MRHGSLFSGIGGFELAATWMYWENIFHCEKDTFCQKVLKYYWPESISYKDIYEFDATIYRGCIDILTGGFPCQPFSVAGKRKGQKDDRYLWPETLRIIEQIRPAWCVFENVTGLLTILEPKGLSEVESKAIQLFYEDKLPKTDTTITSIHQRVIGTIIKDIGNAGYLLPELKDGTPVVLCIPACAVNAPHRRDRIWFIAYTNQPGLERRKESRNVEKKRSQPNKHTVRSDNRPDWNKWPAQPPIYSRDDGISTGLDGISVSTWRKESIKSFGNSIVPELAYQIFAAIEQTEAAIIEEIK
jgi:DNA (cytosine-5)-methyltransferase 1